MKKKENNTHPIHARGVRSPTYSNVVGKPLTNKTIEKYILSGRYGEAAKQRLLAARKTEKKPTSVSLALKALQ